MQLTIVILTLVSAVIYAGCRVFRSLTEVESHCKGCKAEACHRRGKARDTGLREGCQNHRAGSR